MLVQRRTSVVGLFKNATGVRVLRRRVCRALFENVVYAFFCCLSIVNSKMGNCCTVCTATDGPIIRCRTASAYLGDKNVRLTCEVRARPGLTSLFWIIDFNGTAITEGVVVDEYWSLTMVSTEQHTISLLLIH